MRATRLVRAAEYVDRPWTTALTRVAHAEPAAMYRVMDREGRVLEGAHDPQVRLQWPCHVFTIGSFFSLLSFLSFLSCPARAHGASRMALSRFL